MALTGTGVRQSEFLGGVCYQRLPQELSVVLQSLTTAWS